MTEETNKNGPDAAAHEAHATEAAEQQAAGEEEGASERQVDPVEALKAENADLRDRFLRLAADMDNLRRFCTKTMNAENFQCIDMKQEFQHTDIFTTDFTKSSSCMPRILLPSALLACE